MGRIRTIKPEFPQSESMGRVSREARLLFILLWTICDDDGRGRGSSRMLASLLYPYDPDAPELIDGWMAELEREACVVRYIGHDGASYFESLNWNKHQKIDRPSRSKIEPPTEEMIREYASKSRDPSRGLHEAPRMLVLGSRIKDQGPRIEGSGIEGPSEGKPSGAKAPKDDTKSLPKKEPNPSSETVTETDDRQWLFKEGLHYLSIAMNREPSGLRSTIGKWLKDLDDDAARLRAIFQDAAALKPASAVSWITAAVAKRLKDAPVSRAKSTSGEMSEDDDWRWKLKTFIERKFWAVAVDGAPPDQIGHRVPSHIHQEFYLPREKGAGGYTARPELTGA